MNEYMNKAQEIINEWNDMTPEQQLNFCKACVCKAIKQRRTLKPGYDMEDAIQETYCKMLQRLPDVGTLAKNIEQRANKGFGDSLAAIVIRAATTKRGSPHLRKTLYQIVRTYLLKAPADEPVYQFLDKKRAEGKPYFVYMTAAQNKFLRIYYARVKECLLAADTRESSES